MKKILIFVLCLMPLVLMGQTYNVRHIITADGEVTFWRGQQQLFVRGYAGEPIYVADYYVATNGSDSNDGLTITTPFQTITKAESVMVAGDTVMIRGGNYNESVLVYGISGTAENPIVFMAYPGESPIIDGTGIEIVLGGALIMIYGDYIYVSGFEITNANSGGSVIMLGDHQKLSNMNIHEIWGSAVTMVGNYSIVEDCHVWRTALSNEPNPGEDINDSGINVRRRNDEGSSSNNIIRRNIVHDIWGEGITSANASFTTVEDNIIYDCWSVLLYFRDSKNSIAQRNLIYTTKVMINGTQVGIGHWDEYWEEEEGLENENNTFINNIVYGCNRNFYGGFPTGTIVANNTFVNSSYFACVQISINGVFGTSFKNNIIVQEDGLQCIYLAEGAPIAFSNNLYNKTYNTFAIGAGDVIGDPLFTKTGSLGAGLLTGHYFDLGTGSPAINAGTDTGVVTDFFENARVGAYDIGAIEKQ